MELSVIKTINKILDGMAIMREAKIILKEKIQEFRNLEDLLDSCDNIGITYDGKRFILTHDDAKL